jgi:phosphate:Na+ symporter
MTVEFDSVLGMPYVIGTAEIASSSEGLDLVVLFAGLFGGLALFLLGLDRLTDSLKLVAGNRLRTVITRLTTNRFAGLMTGAGVTAVIQSSSVTTVLVVGFISSGVMTLSQSVGVIMGANIGTTVTAQIIAFNVTRYALLIVAAGFGVVFFARKEHQRSWGSLVLGLGLVFFGMSVMSDGMSPLRSEPAFIDAMASMENPFLGILVAALFTALVQSSSATTAIVIVLAGQGLVTIEAGIALILGANVGTSVTALLAALGKPREALRAAVVHTLFNVVGVVLWVGFVPLLADAVIGIGGDVPRQVANAHSIFNVANALIMIGFSTRIAKLAETLVPDRPDPFEAIVRTRHLDNELLKTPTLAIDRARLELIRMAERVRRMLREIMPAVLEGDYRDLAEIESLDDEVDSLHGQIVRYLGRIGQTRLSEESADEVMGLMEATNDLESIGDIIEKNLIAAGRSRLENAIPISPGTATALGEFHSLVQHALDLSLTALTEKDMAAARESSGMKETVNSRERALQARQAERLVAPEPNRVAAYRLEIDIVANLKRIYYFAKRIARAAVPAEERAGM